jgi:hypothetical protein
VHWGRRGPAVRSKSGRFDISNTLTGKLAFIHVPDTHSVASQAGARRPVSISGRQSAACATVQGGRVCMHLWSQMNVVHTMSRIVSIHGRLLMHDYVRVIGVDRRSSGPAGAAAGRSVVIGEMRARHTPDRSTRDGGRSSRVGVRRADSAATSQENAALTRGAAGRPCSGYWPSVLSGSGPSVKTGGQPDRGVTAATTRVPATSENHVSLQ